jgi:hypothetical protein
MSLFSASSSSTYSRQSRPHTSMYVTLTTTPSRPRLYHRSSHHLAPHLATCSVAVYQHRNQFRISLMDRKGKGIRLAHRSSEPFSDRLCGGLEGRGAKVTISMFLAQSCGHMALGGVHTQEHEDAWRWRRVGYGMISFGPFWSTSALGWVWEMQYGYGCGYLVRG